jgi:putative ABC transport system permease protein
VNRSWLGVWSRGLRAEPLRSVGVAVLLLVTVLIASSVPRVLSRASDSALHQELAAAPATVRNLELVQYGRITPSSGANPLESVAAAGATLETRYPAPIPAVISTSQLVVDTPLWHPSAGTPLDSVLNLRIQEGVDQHIKLSAGRLPTGATKLIPDPTPQADPDSQLMVLEVATSSQTAAKLQLPIGGRLILDPEPSDPLAAKRGIRMAVDLVGTYDVTDPADPYWMNDASVARPYIYALSALVEYVGATMLLAPAAYPALIQATQPSGLPLAYRWRSYIDPTLVETSLLDPISDGLRRAETIYPPTTPTLTSGGTFSGPDHMSPASLGTGLLRLIATHQARWQSGATILTILWTGAGLVMVSSLALVAEVIARRRRSALGIVRRRGASPRQVGAAILGEAIILVVPATIIGAGLAIILVPVDDQLPSVIVAGVVALVAVGLMALANRRNRGDAAPDLVRRPRRAGSGRLVAEGLVVILAVLGAVLLHQRNAASVSSQVGADPFLAAAPALVGLAVGIVAVRLLPLVLGGLGRLLARGRGLVAVLGFRRASRDSGVAAVLVVALTATSVGTFAAALLDQIDQGALSASWQTTGADFQVAGDSADLAAFSAHLPAGVEASTSLSIQSVAVSTGGARNLVVIDPAGLAAVTAGTPADPALPEALLGPASGDVPAIVSSGAEDVSALSVGQQFSVRIGGTPVTLQAAEVRDVFAGVTLGEPFVVVSGAQLAALTNGFVPAPTDILIRAPSLSLDQVQASTAGLLSLTVQGQAANQATIRGAPAVSAVSLGIVSGAIAVLVYGLLTIILAIALDTASRRTETARLQILGLSNRQSVILVIAEFAPAVVVGVAVGLGLGVVLIEFVGPGLGLPAVLGVAGLAASSPQLGRLVVLALGILALIGVATLLSTLLERQRQLATAVREGTQ